MALIERDGFMASMQKHFENVAEGEGHCILLCGEAGIGKMGWLLRTPSTPRIEGYLSLGRVRSSGYEVCSISFYETKSKFGRIQACYLAGVDFNI